MTALIGVLGMTERMLFIITSKEQNVNGHKGSGRRASAGDSGTGRTRKADRGRAGKPVAQSDGDAPKRGRGRPKGSKNKATIEREQVERAAKRAAKTKPASGKLFGAKPVVAAAVGKGKSVKATGQTARARQSRGLAAKSKSAAKSPAARKGGSGGGRKVAGKPAKRKR